jgi:hypothetical protein
MSQSRKLGPKRPKRGKYATLGDIHFLACLIKDQSLSSQTRFLVNGKMYLYSEVIRRIRRAKRAGTIGPEKPAENSARHSHIEVIDNTSKVHHIPLETNDCFENLGDHSALLQEYARWAETMDPASQKYFLNLVSLRNNATILPPLSDADHMGITARFYYNIIRYFRGAHDNGRFIFTESNELLSHVYRDSMANVNDFYICCITAIDLLDRQIYKPGFQLISRALWLLETLLDEQDPKLIDTICDVCTILLTKGWDEVFDVLRERICGIIQISAMREGEESHPWPQLFACFCKLPRKQIYETLQQGWKCGYDQLEGILPGRPWDGLNISCASDHSLRMGKHLAKLHQDILWTWFSEVQPAVLKSMRRQFACGEILHSKGDYREAAGTLDSVVYRCAQARQTDDERWLALEVEALEASARSHIALSRLGREEPTAAEAVIQTAVIRSTAVWGATSATTIALRHLLWQWLLEIGRDSEANMLRQTIDAMLDKVECERSDVCTNV